MIKQSLKTINRLIVNISNFTEAKSVQIHRYIKQKYASKPQVLKIAFTNRHLYQSNQNIILSDLDQNLITIENEAVPLNDKLLYRM